MVSGETRVTGRSSLSLGLSVKVSAAHAEALLTRMSTGPNSDSALSNRTRGVSARERSASRAMAEPPFFVYVGKDGRSVGGAVGSIFARAALARTVFDPPIRDHDGRTRFGEAPRGGGTDAVVGPGDDGNVAGEVECGHVRRRTVGGLDRLSGPGQGAADGENIDQVGHPLPEHGVGQGAESIGERGEEATRRGCCRDVEDLGV